MLAAKLDHSEDDWFASLDHLTEDVLRTNPQATVIGAGAFGLPLAAALARSGTIALHISGALQLWFGIMGGRWDNNTRITSLQNERWVRPSSVERPDGWRLLEGGAYW